MGRRSVDGPRRREDRTGWHSPRAVFVLYRPQSSLTSTSAAWRTCQSRSTSARCSAASTSGPSNGARAITARRRIAGLSPCRAGSSVVPARRRWRRALPPPLPAQRLLVARAELDQPGQRRVVHVFVLAAGPCRHLDDERVGVRQQGQQRDGAMGGRDLGRSPADDGRCVGEGGGEDVVVQLVQPFQCTERRCPHGRVVRGQTGTGARFVALMACERDARRVVTTSGR